VQTRALTFTDRQHALVLQVRLWRRITQTLLEECLHEPDFDLSICFVTTSEITRLNEMFLQHDGPTDVITFDYSDGSSTGQLSGEIVICVDEAVSQARRFRTAWQSELVRYIIHGLLHLRGYDDRQALARSKMKRAEDRLLGQLANRFNLRKLGNK